MALEVTLFLASVTAAYELPPSETTSAVNATSIAGEGRRTDMVSLLVGCRGRLWRLRRRRIGRTLYLRAREPPYVVPGFLQGSTSRRARGIPHGSDSLLRGERRPDASAGRESAGARSSRLAAYRG